MADSLTGLLEAIKIPFDLAMGRAEQVEEACLRLRQQLSSPPDPSETTILQQLLPLLRVRVGKLPQALFRLFEEILPEHPQPWDLLQGMLSAADPTLIRRSLMLMRRVAGTPAFKLEPEALEFLAERIEIEGSPLGESASLQVLKEILLALPAASEETGWIEDLFRGAERASVRRLAARLLDLEGQPPPPELTQLLLGAESYAFLRPYLEYTRASHMDLLALLPQNGSPPPCLLSFRRAAALCGQDLLREVVSELGWPGISLGLEVRHYLGIRIGSAFPLLLPPREASLFRPSQDITQESEYYLFIAHGGQAAENPRGTDNDARVARFRNYNLTHAMALAEILDIAPLTSERVHRLLALMDPIVQDFSTLFASHSEECAILPSVYQELKDQILVELEKQESQSQLSAELTRLVQMFDDPESLGEVRTLHGLKRYLHQRGLRLGFHLVEAGRSTNRTVDLLVASPRRVLRSVRGIRYIDFEPVAVELHSETGIPRPVTLLSEAFAFQLLHGQERFPSVRIFCYGNEVHYYLAYGNHPAFLRLDYSPPLLGGMIDLDYFGVSKSELSLHPDPSLRAIDVFFRHLEFGIQIESTRIHARYDKERALDLGDLCRKVEWLFRLTPYLMDLDWIIGYLEVDSEVRQKIAEAWARHFTAWGTLPISQLLTSDRKGILVSIETGPAGGHEEVWSGCGPYTDRFSYAIPDQVLHDLQQSLLELGLPAPALNEPFGPIWFEQKVSAPLREALECGEIVDSAEGFRRESNELYQRDHDARRFAEILASGDDVLAASARLAVHAAPLMRTLRFQITGAVNGHEVQCARVTLRDQWLSLYVLLGEAGVARLALYTRGGTLYRRRSHTADPWQSNGSCDSVDLAKRLRRSNYLFPGSAIVPNDAPVDADHIRDYFRQPNPRRVPAPLPGERLATGLKASPGRAVGIALFGTERRTPTDFDGAVLISPTVQPEDSTFLYHARGIVSTGGGILSHAGLIATQFHKPALIISGNWHREPDGSLTLLYRTLEYREEEQEVSAFRVRIRRDMREREYRLQEGDLVVLEADEGLLRVLGQGLEALALHHGLRLFNQATSQLVHTTDEQDILRLRGIRLREFYQLKKLLGRLSSPVLGCHAAMELLLGETAMQDSGSLREQTQLLHLLRANPRIGQTVHDFMLEMVRQVQQKYQARQQRARQHMPTTLSLCEALALRMEVLHLRQALDSIRSPLLECGLQIPELDAHEAIALDGQVRRRLIDLRKTWFHQARGCIQGSGKAPRLRHLLRQLERVHEILSTPQHDQDATKQLFDRLSADDRTARERAAEKQVITPEDGGFELYPLIGWKAANLAEVARLCGPWLVPNWVVISHRAFEKVLEMPVERAESILDNLPRGQASLRDAIAAAMSLSELSYAQRSALIRGLWDRVRLPDELVDAVSEAYRRLTEDNSGSIPGSEDRQPPFVAIRSSALEEDAEAAARAGEFDTFLFISGEKMLLDHLRRAWSGLWTERAIHNRAVLGGSSGRAGGGIIIQRIAWSRVSGVLHTINSADGEFREMVINVGLGLGEGIVSGTVAADQVIIDKQGDLEHGPLRFRYITADKRDQVLFNRRAGFGTCRSECLYHQRLRPALEYVELGELASTAAKLEAAYGYPLDIEFAIEGTKLWILQARPVAISQSLFLETRGRYPLARVPESVRI